MDELTSGEDRPRRRGFPRGAAAPLLVLGTIALVLVALGAGHRDDSPRPAPTPSETVAAATSLEVSGVCTLLTDGGDTLVVTFRLTNRSSATVVLDAVEPSFPLHGLVAEEIAYSIGDCLRSAPAAAPTRIGPQDGVRVTFRLGLPAECPAPLPIQAVLHVHIGETTDTATVAVLPDLGSVTFTQCPSG